MRRVPGGCVHAFDPLRFIHMQRPEGETLVELAAALRGEVEARIEGEHDRLLEVSQIVIDALLALAKASMIKGPIR